MVRKYKKKPFYEASKIPQEQIFKVVAAYSMGQSAKTCAEQVGLSRQSVQKIYAELGERVAWLLEGNFPSSNNRLGDFIAQFGDVAAFNQLVEVLKDHSGHILSLYGAEITYEDFKRYRESGVIEIDTVRGGQDNSTTQFFRYRLLNLLLRLSEKNYGIKEAHYTKHYAFCRLYFLVMTVMIVIIHQETRQLEKSYAEFHANLLKQVEEGDQNTQLENMIFEAKCNMILAMVLIFSLYDQPI